MSCTECKLTFSTERVFNAKKKKSAENLNQHPLHLYFSRFRFVSKRQPSVVRPGFHGDPTVPQPAATERHGRPSVHGHPGRELLPHAADHVGELCGAEQEPHQRPDGVCAVAPHAGHHRSRPAERALPPPCVSPLLSFSINFFFFF